MKRIFKFAAVAAAFLLLAGCLGSAFNLGSSAPPPTDVKVTPGDSSVSITWTSAPNVQYWLFTANASAVTPQNWNQLTGGKAYINVTSPLLVPGLVNGATYSFTLNGRIDDGPGGAGSPSISAVPRLAGASWTAGSPLANDLRSATFGSVFVAVGARGAIYTSPDFNAWSAVTWTQQQNPLTSPPDLYAATSGGGLYLAGGAAGTILTSSDAATWTARSSGTVNALYGMVGNGLGAWVAVGEKGTIITSGDGVNWFAKSSGTSNDLFAVTYGNGIFMAVGANGTLLASTDTSNWLAIPTNTTSDLHGVSIGINLATAKYAYLAVGAAGTIVTSSDGLIWTVQAPMTSNNLNAIAYSRQFVIVGDGGTVITSTDGTTMQLQNSGSSSNLTAVTSSIYSLFAVGLAGTNLFSL